MTSRKWWYLENGATQGPVDEGDLVLRIRSGSLPADTLVWTPALPEWQTAAAAEELRSQLPPTPPPAPATHLRRPPPSTAVELRKPTGVAWSRWFARVCVDYSLAALVLAVFVAVVSPESKLLESDYALMFVAAALWVPVEAALMSGVGSTPGKALMALRVTHASGRKLSFGEASSRAVSAWATGLAFAIPIISLVTLNRQYNLVRKGGQASWDQERNLVYSALPLSAGRKFFVGVVVCSIIMSFVFWGYAAESQY